MRNANKYFMSFVLPQRQKKKKIVGTSFSTRNKHLYFFLHIFKNIWQYLTFLLLVSKKCIKIFGHNGKLF